MSAAPSADAWSVSQAETFQELLAVEGNERCFGCGVSKPSWASVNLGVLLCLTCAGRHRGLGVQTSFVRSLTLDRWTPKQICFMRLGGNSALRRWFSDHGHPPQSCDHRFDCDPAQAYRKDLKSRVYASLGLDEAKEEAEQQRRSSYHQVAMVGAGSLSSADMFGKDSFDARWARGHSSGSLCSCCPRCSCSVQ